MPRRPSCRPARRPTSPPPLHVLLNLPRDPVRDVVVDLQRVTPRNRLVQTHPLRAPRRLGIEHGDDSAVRRGRALRDAIAVVVHLEERAVIAPLLEELRRGTR
eukprot:29380-Pelagococcus_subviridis.AAC.21